MRERQTGQGWRRNPDDHNWNVGDTVEHLKAGQRRLVVNIDRGGRAWIAQPNGRIRPIKNPGMWVVWRRADERSVGHANMKMSQAEKVGRERRRANARGRRVHAHIDEYHEFAIGGPVPVESGRMQRYETATGHGTVLSGPLADLDRRVAAVCAAGAGRA